MNLQEREAIAHVEDGSLLDVIHIWDTIQGEGPFIGLPSVFIRLAGCNLQCPLCDTNYTRGRTLRTVEKIVETVMSFCPSPFHRLVVLTGGEPMRQNIKPLVEALMAMGLCVQVETNGTFYILGLPYDNNRFWVVCSPKTPKINTLLAPEVDYWKYVVQDGFISPQDGLPTQTLGDDADVARPHKAARRPIFLMPLDEGDPVKNAANAQAAITSCRRFGYRLTIQIHKQLGLE